MSRKYDALGKYLTSRSSQNEVALTFLEVEKIIGSKLPSSAHAHRPWWSNNPSNNVMTRVWLDAGFEAAQVDMKGKRLVFRRTRNTAPGMAEEEREFVGPEENRPAARHPLIGALKGLLWLDPDYDFTQPLWGEEDEKAFNEKWDRLLK